MVNQPRRRRYLLYAVDPYKGPALRIPPWVVLTVAVLFLAWTLWALL